MAIRRFLNFGLLYVLIGLYSVIDGFSMWRRTGIPYGPGQYMLIIGALLLVVGIFYYVKQLKQAGADQAVAVPKKEEEEEPVEYPAGVAPCFSLNFRLAGRDIRIGPAMLAFALFALYTILVRVIGYLASSIFFVAAAMLLFGERKWWRLALVSIVSGVAFWMAFIRVAGLPL